MRIASLALAAALTGSAALAQDPGPAPDKYPPCSIKVQDRCSVPKGRMQAHRRVHDRSALERATQATDAKLENKVAAEAKAPPKSP